MPDKVPIHEKLVSYENAPGGELVIKEQQYVPDEYISTLRKEREDSLHTPAGEFHRVASIPTAWVDKWKREGFDIMKEPIVEILKRLRKEEFDAFITSNKVR
jgi:hypothetical protein